MQGGVKSRGGDKGGSSVNLGCFLKYLSQKKENIAPVYWVFKSNCLLWSSILFCLSLSFFEWRSFVPLSNLFEWSFSPSIRIYAPCRQRKGACENTKSNWLYPCRFSHPSDSIPFKDICLIKGITFYFVSWFTWLLLLYDSSFSFWWFTIPVQQFSHFFFMSNDWEKDFDNGKCWNESCFKLFTHPKTFRGRIPSVNQLVRWIMPDMNYFQREWDSMIFV